MVVVCGDVAMHQGLGGRWWDSSRWYGVVLSPRIQAMRRLGPIILKLVIESIKHS